MSGLVTRVSSGLIAVLPKFPCHLGAKQEAVVSMLGLKKGTVKFECDFLHPRKPQVMRWKNRT